MARPNLSGSALRLRAARRSRRRRRVDGGARVPEVRAPVQEGVGHHRVRHARIGRVLVEDRRECSTPALSNGVRVVPRLRRCRGDAAQVLRRRCGPSLRRSGAARRRPSTSFDPVRDTNRLLATSSRFRPASPRRAGWPTGLPRADRAESGDVKPSNSRTSRRSSVPGRRRSPARSRELALTA